MRRLAAIAIILVAGVASAADPPAAPATPAAPPPAPAAAPPPVPAPVGAVAPLDHILALVDGAPIWLSAYAEALANLPPAPDLTVRKQMEDALLVHLIGDALIAHRAHALHVEVTDDEVDQGVKTILAQNNLDLAGLQAALAQMHMTMPTYRDSLRQQILDIKTFQIWVATQPPFERTQDALSQAHDRWVNELAQSARIERR